MRILLVQHSRENVEAYPLGLGYVAAVLRDAGHNVGFLDLALESGDYIRTLLQKIEENGIQALGFTVMTPQYVDFLELVEKIKPYLDRIPIVVGGPHASALPEEVLRDGAADVVVISEGEEVAPILFRELERDGDLDSIPGIAFLDSAGQFVQTSPGSQVADLDTIPFPPWDILHPKRYRGTIRGLRMANMLTSRGCPYRCIYCYRGPSGGVRFRKRSIENILEEIRRLYCDYGIRALGFKDDIFTLDMDHSRELCDAFLTERLRILWTCETRVDRVDLSLLKRMMDAGCVCIDFGVETGSAEILEKLRKRTSKEQARQAFRYCHEIGMPCRAYFMIGTPWETPETIQETIAFAKELRATISVFFLATPYPGSELRQEFIKAGWKVPEDYSEYRHFVEGRSFVYQNGDDPDIDRNRFFTLQCQRATKEVMLSQVYDIWGYPRLAREYLRRYSYRELAVRIMRRVSRAIIRSQS